MARPTSEEIQQRRERMAEVAGLGGWYVSKLLDGEDEDGKRISWHQYEHLDGRRATVSQLGKSSDPELQKLLDSQRHMASLAQPDSQEWMSPIGLIRILGKWLGRR